MATIIGPRTRVSGTTKIQFKSRQKVIFSKIFPNTNFRKIESKSALITNYFRLKAFWDRITKNIQEENIDEILEKAVENVDDSNLGWGDGEYDEADDDDLECWPRIYEQDERISVRSFVPANPFAVPLPVVRPERPANPFPPTIGFWRPF